MPRFSSSSSGIPPTSVATTGRAARQGLNHDIRAAFGVTGQREHIGRRSSQGDRGGIALAGEDNARSLEFRPQCAGSQQNQFATGDVADQLEEGGFSSRSPLVGISDRRRRSAQPLDRSPARPDRVALLREKDVESQAFRTAVTFCSGIPKSLPRWRSSRLPVSTADARSIVLRVSHRTTGPEIRRMSEPIAQTTDGIPNCRAIETAA